MAVGPERVAKQRMRREWWWLVRVLALALLPISAGLARDEAALRACIQAHLPQQSLALRMHLQQTGPEGLNELRGDWIWRRDSKTQSGVLRLTAPAHLAGTAYLFLMRGDAPAELFMYVPATGKARRVNGATVSQSLFGSGLSAFDLKLLLGGLRGGQMTPLAGAARENGRAVEHWRYLPLTDPDMLYDRIDLTVDASSCLPLRAAMFGGVPWKIFTLDAERVREQNGRWIVERATLRDLRQDTTTQITLSQQRIDEPIPAERFRPDRFYRAP